jgi:hypothetical protein
VTDNQAIGIHLEDLEKVFKILGWKAGVAVLDQRITEFVKATDPKIAHFLKDMEKYDKPRLQGSPASEHNRQKTDTAGLNYFAPMKNLQVMLCKEWFDKVSADKRKYTTAWREKFVADLMASEYRDKIAENWAKSDQRLQIKGRMIGALIAADVINKKALAVARTYYNINENTSEVKTLAKYMGDSRKEYYTDWIVDYVKSQQPIEK